MNIAKVISGGQTGADIAGLVAARDSHVRTGGTAPHGWRTEQGPSPQLAEFGLVEHESSNYLMRTECNVIDSDLTLIFGRPTSSGGRATIDFCQTYGRPFKSLYWSHHDGLDDGFCDVLAADLTAWLESKQLGKGLVVNIAGNRESTNPGIEFITYTVLCQVLQYRKETLNVS